MSSAHKCHVCSGGTGNTTCLACVTGSTGEYGSKRFIRLMANGIIDGKSEVVLGTVRDTNRLVLTKWQERKLNSIKARLA